MKSWCAKVLDSITTEKEKGRVSEKLIRGRMEIV